LFMQLTGLHGGKGCRVSVFLLPTEA